MRDFDDFYRERYRDLVASVTSAVGDPDVADDAASEAFLRAFSDWGRVQGMVSPSGWTYTVAINVARRSLRRARQEGALLASLPQTPVGDVHDGTWDVVRALPERQRTAVVLRHVADLTEGEIATRMGGARSTVSSTLRDAYRTLVGALAPARSGGRSMDEYVLGVATSCGPQSCQVILVDGGDGEFRYSAAMQDTIKVRPGDLVALDAAAGEVVYRWWRGTVDRVEDGRAEVRRNVTQRKPDDPRQGTKWVEIPSELAADVAPGVEVHFSADEVVAVGQKRRLSFKRG